MSAAEVAALSLSSRSARSAWNQPEAGWVHVRMRWLGWSDGPWRLLCADQRPAAPAHSSGARGAGRRHRRRRRAVRRAAGRHSARTPGEMPAVTIAPAVSRSPRGRCGRRSAFATRGPRRPPLPPRSRFDSLAGKCAALLRACRRRNDGSTRPRQRWRATAGSTTRRMRWVARTVAFLFPTFPRTQQKSLTSPSHGDRDAFSHATFLAALAARARVCQELLLSARAVCYRHSRCGPAHVRRQCVGSAWLSDRISQCRGRSARLPRVDRWPGGQRYPRSPGAPASSDGNPSARFRSPD
jgi:hypothetical protein